MFACDQIISATFGHHHPSYTYHFSWFLSWSPPKMEWLICLTSLVRLSLVLGFFLVNILSVLRLFHHTVLRGVGGGRLTSPSVTAPLCNHLISTAFTLVACTVYLASWLPYLISVFIPDLWPYFQVRKRGFFLFASLLRAHLIPIDIFSWLPSHFSGESSLHLAAPGHEPGDNSIARPFSCAQVV